MPFDLQVNPLMTTERESGWSDTAAGMAIFFGLLALTVATSVWILYWSKVIEPIARLL